MMYRFLEVENGGAWGSEGVSRGKQRIHGLVMPQRVDEAIEVNLTTNSSSIPIPSSCTFIQNFNSKIDLIEMMKIFLFY